MLNEQLPSIGRIYKRKDDLQEIFKLLYDEYIIVVNYNELTTVNGADYSQMQFIPVDKPDYKRPMSLKTFNQTYELVMDYEAG